GEILDGLRRLLARVPDVRSDPEGIQQVRRGCAGQGLGKQWQPGADRWRTPVDWDRLRAIPALHARGRVPDVIGATAVSSGPGLLGEGPVGNSYERGPIRTQSFCGKIGGPFWGHPPPREGARGVPATVPARWRQLAWLLSCIPIWACDQSPELPPRRHGVGSW